MSDHKNVYIVIPARSGSKGIPEKNLTYLNKETLLERCISKACQLVDAKNIILTTNDHEISMIGRSYGVTVVHRTNELSQDHTTLDPVVHDALSGTTAKFGDIVITLQVTSPNWLVTTLNSAISYFKNKKLDTLISGKAECHLSWQKTDFGYKPDYKERKNRQNLTPRYIETGAFIITKYENITKKSRIGKRLEIYCLPESESDDIDSPSDFAQAKYYDDNQRIAIHVIGQESTGTGHIFNCIEIVRRIPDKRVTFFVHPNDHIAVDILTSKHYNVVVTNDIIKSIIDYEPATVILDCLNTEIKNVLLLKEKGIRVISFEDFGSGSHHTDYTFNALYPRSVQRGNIYSGPEFFLVKNDLLFGNFLPKSNSDSVLVFFGGTDPMQHTEQLISEIENYGYSDLQFSILFGVGKKNKNHLRQRVKNFSNVKTYDYVPSISRLISEHKVAITSGGRTMYELSVMQKPFVVAFQNEREKLHFQEFKVNTDISCFDSVSTQLMSAVYDLVSNDKKYLKVQRQLESLRIGKSTDKIIDAVRKC